MKRYDLGCLVIHGFAGSRSEIGMLVNSLKEKGVRMSVPLLKGHESGKNELAKATYSDWIKSAEDSLNILEAECERVIILGFSMGGLIGANLYRTHRVSAMVFINTPIYYWNVKLIAKNLFNDFGTYSKRYCASGTDKSLKSLFQFVTLLNRTKPLFSYIDCPAMIIQTLDDDTVNPQSACYICSKLTGQMEVRKFKTGGHMVFLSDTGNEVCAAVNGYIDRIAYDRKEAG